MADDETVEEVVEEEQDDLRGELEAAFDAAEEPDESAVPVAAEAAPAEEAPKAEEVAPEPTAEAEPEPAAEPEPEAESISAPGSWKPEAREHWKDLPRTIQEEVARRERDHAVSIQRDAEAVRYGNEMGQALAPFQQVIAMEGTNEVEAMRNLAQTAAGLRMGTDDQKAQIVSNIIQAYGVDINVLDNILAGEPALPPEQQQFMQMIDQRLAPMQQFMQGMEQRTQQYGQQQDQNIGAEVEQFSASNEFVSDVRGEMADFLDVAASQGREMSLQEAYDRSIAMRPDIQKVIQDRNAVTAAQQSQQALEAKQAAASSIPSSAAAPAAAGAAQDLRGAIEEAWDSGVAQ